MSLAERYSRATRSSHLEWKVEPSDIDLLIAAGLVRESLATRLIRLRSEFDSTGGDRMAIRLLRGFQAARFVLMSYAVAEATTRGKGLTDYQAADIAVRVLDLFLDPSCPQCDGRGFTGGYGIPTIRCVPCRESGKRLAFWKTDVEEGFAAWLQSSLEGKIERTLSELRHLKRMGSEPQKLKASIQNGLQGGDGELT